MIRTASLDDTPRIVAIRASARARPVGRRKPAAPDERPSSSL